MKKIFMAVLCLFLISACAQEEKKPEKNMADEYTELAKENVFVYAPQEDILAMLEHGTGIVFLGFPECPFCQAYAPMLNDAVKDTGLKVLYYNIFDDRLTHTEFYQKVVSLLDGQLDFDSSGKPRIYVPDVTFVIGGEIVGHDNESSLLDSSEVKPEEYWTAEKKEALHKKLQELAEKTAEAKTLKDKEGCDTGCKVGG